MFKVLAHQNVIFHACIGARSHTSPSSERSTVAHGPVIGEFRQVTDRQTYNDNKTPCHVDHSVVKQWHSQDLRLQQTTFDEAKRGENESIWDAGPDEANGVARIFRG